MCGVGGPGEGLAQGTADAMSLFEGRALGSSTSTAVYITVSAAEIRLFRLAIARDHPSSAASLGGRCVWIYLFASEVSYAHLQLEGAVPPPFALRVCRYLYSMLLSSVHYHHQSCMICVSFATFFCRVVVERRGLVRGGPSGAVAPPPNSKWRGRAIRS